jgi:hypothetical protein
VSSGGEKNEAGNEESVSNRMCKRSHAIHLTALQYQTRGFTSRFQSVDGSAAPPVRLIGYSACRSHERFSTMLFMNGKH